MEACAIVDYEAAFAALGRSASSMYWDICTVTRRQNVKNPVTKITETEDIPAGSFPCRLSSGLPRSPKLEPNTTVEAVPKLFSDVDADVKAGDLLTITRKAGDTLQFTAGKPYRFRSHMEVELKEREDA